jgi:carboxylesterase
MDEKYAVVQNAEELYHQGNEIGVLVLHGFTGTTQSVKPVYNVIKDKGYTVYAPRLKGHGTHHEDMEKSTKEDWLSSAQEGYEKLTEACERIFVTGLSMGGTLALHLGTQYQNIAGIIPINPAIDMPHLKQQSETEARFLTGIGSDIKKEGVHELAYEKTPVASIRELTALMEKVKNKLHQVTSPLLLLSSKTDNVVPPHNSQYVFSNVESKQKEMVTLPNSFHVATLDHDQGFLCEKIVKFISERC